MYFFLLGRCQGTSYESGFKILMSYLLDLKSHATSPEIEEFLDSHSMSKSKVYQMTQRHGDLRTKKHLEYLRSDPKIALGVDGKKSNVRQQHGRMSQKDKEVIIDQVTKKYIGFFIPESGEARILAQAFYSYLEEIGAVDSLLSLSLDGPNQNVGEDNGFLRYLKFI